MANRSAAQVGIRPPLLISKDELFFWTQKWREGEAESAAERERGDVVQFKSSTELLNWLTDDS